MSGTSLDGLDLAFCEFHFDGSKYHHRIIEAETIPYTSTWKERLANLENRFAIDYVATDVEYGHFLGLQTRMFLERHRLIPDFIASHGHTIFHQPRNRITSQIGRGACIAAETGLPVVCDFRSLDVALGGQGAPLVPIGDELLFGQFAYCLNIGGFANISFSHEGKRIAFDIAPANIVLNYLVMPVGLDFDRNGEMARSGRVDAALLEQFNAMDFYSYPAPKSLGKEWVLQHIHPLLAQSGLSREDQLATFTEHIAIQTGRSLSGNAEDKILVTGGGAFNCFLMERIRLHTSCTVNIPDELTVNYKEALIFAFLGLLRHRNEINCLSSVTGAVRDSSGGAVY
jgi:anhydro-N-acetylmuramic acid kinase